MKFSSAAVTLAANYNLNLSEVDQFLFGVVYTIVNEDNLPEMKKCMESGEGIEAEVVKAVSEMESGKMEDIIKGAEDIIKVIQELPGVFAECKDVQGDLTKLSDWGQNILDNPEALVSNVLKHYKEIMADVTQMNSDLSAAKYE